MMKLVTVCFTASLLVACGPPRQQTAAHPAKDIPASSSAEIYAIYDAVLRIEGADAKKLGIVRATSFHDTCGDSPSGTSQLKEAMLDFKLRNKQSRKLEPNFDLPFPYVLVNALEQVGGARPPPPGKSDSAFIEEEMAKLQKRIDEGYSEVSLSLPGFSNDGSVAAVYVAISFAGAGYILHRDGNRWTVDPKRFCEWIS